MYNILLDMKAQNTAPPAPLLMEDLESLSLKSVESPPPQGLELLMEDLESLSLKSVESPPPKDWNFLFGGLRKFEFETGRIPPPHAPPLELLMELWVWAQ